jgi:ferredoxin-type protein NapF
MQKRELFSSLGSIFGNNASKEGETKIIRPPYFSDITLFDSECKECDGACANVCEENIIKIASDSTPYLDLQISGCTYCDECAVACERDVLKVEYKSNIDATISIDILSCLSWNSTMCFSCKDPCLDNAIDFLAMFRPSINQDRCTCCGFCIKYCPTGAIKVE